MAYVHELYWMCFSNFVYWCFTGAFIYILATEVKQLFRLVLILFNVAKLDRIDYF